MIKLIDILKEIGDASSLPYVSSDSLSLNIEKTPNNFNIATGEFKTDSGIIIKYEFRGINPGIYGFEFTNQLDISSQHSQKATPKEYLRIMSTVALIINKFLSENDIEELWISGADKPGSEGQKNKIYMKYIENLLKSNNKYFLKHDEDYLVITTQK